MNVPPAALSKPPASHRAAGHLQPRPHQAAALAAIGRAHAMAPRAQLVSACGTGKTLTGRWYAEAAGSRITAVFVPSLALVAQAIGDWSRARDAAWRHDTLIVCSDPSTAAGAAERALETGGDVDRETWAAAAAKVTTSPSRAADALRQAASTGRRLVIFSTYHSAPVVAAACTACSVTLDLIICDEAHHLAGRPRDGFRVVLDDQAIPARRRLFMTATPQILSGDDGVLSMNDTGTYGPVAHAVTFADAIEAGLLADYQVLVIADRRVQDGRQRPDASRGLAVPGAVLAAASSHHLRSMLSFHTYVADAEAFAWLLEGMRLRNGRVIRARPVSARHAGARRAAALNWLGADTGGSELRLLSSARCLAEGVDIPAVDSVLFADPRKSVISIIQATGRALRAAPGKTMGTIIVPVTLPEGGDDDTDLTASEFGHVWMVLRALRAHDQRFAAELDEAAAAIGSTYRRPGRAAASRHLRRVKFIVPGDVDLDEDLLLMRMVEAVSSDSGWERFYQLLLDYARATRGGYLPFNKTWQGADLGQWAQRQAKARKAGLLSAERIARLEAVPGWVWSRAEGHWQDDLRRLQQLAGATPGGLAQAPGGPSIYAGAKDGRRRPLGNRAARYRQLYRDDMLPAEQAARLQELPGWDWNAGLPADDVAMIQALRVYCEFAHHADVPEEHLEDGLPLGRWIAAVRRRKLTGRLHPALAEEIAAATPRGDKGEPGFRWLHADSQWRLAYSALRQYVRREGTAARIPPSHSEQLPDATVQLGQWCAAQRFSKRHGSMDPQHQTWLDGIPGWDWDPPGRRQDYQEPLDLGGQQWHGRAKGIAAGCKCRACVDARRSDDLRDGRARAARRLLALGGAVSAGPARRHLASLERAGATRGTLSAISGVPLGVIRQVANGTTAQIGARHDAQLRAVTAQMVGAAATKAGSRGRVVTAAGQRIAAGRTRELLADLAGRGFGPAWVARELGYAGTSLQLGADSGLITRRVADQVAVLHRRAGTLTVPQSYRGRPVPPLGRLLRECAAEASA